MRQRVDGLPEPSCGEWIEATGRLIEEKEAGLV
jgi:hypothetical protein